MKTENRLLSFFDLDKCKQLIADTPKDEICILCAKWPINANIIYEDLPDEERGEAEQCDLDELGDLLGEFLQVTDYSDLVADPHNLLND